ncbi:MAG TPA: hypothetical protein VMN37_12075 [Gemmatimonadales bacterium]|nr:hypothetical protein [Gemmatimonadales bacterium]
MELIDSATERTTAATDLALALLALGGAAYLHRLGPASLGRRIWVAALVAAGLASLLGAVAHGLVLSDALRETLWQPLYLLLGATVACFVAGAVGDAWGARPARRFLPVMLALALGFYLATRLAGGNFLLFVLFQAAGLLAALLMYGWLARRGRRGARLVAAALALSLAAGAVQADASLTARLVWEFDHNGLYHLVQLAALGLLVAGLGRTLARVPGDAR